MKQTTRINLTIFNNNLFESGTEFFNQLGIKLNSNTTTSLKAKDLLKDFFKNKDIFNAIQETYYLGLVDDSAFGSNASLLNKDKISLKEATDKINPEYKGLMVFAVKLKGSYLPARGAIAELTRAFNRVSKSVPVVLLLKYGGLLSFAASERTKYKQAWREGEKIGKISLLKDINIESPHTGHVKILDDLKVKSDVTTFDALYKQWQEVFNVQLLNKKFYQELFYWYLWAVKNVKFPQIRPKEDLIPDDAHQSESVIRLLTRLLFCWFMKEKQKLIPELLFDKNEIRKILTGFSPENSKSSVFYRAMLQNLFFATLSVPINKRKYIREAFKG
ncbi:MAG TPA: type II restriction endonuclease, partial [Nitrospirae bacterium]|nr:type II restriction endonuclease [Nitrospirota bacterium]